MKTSTFEYIKMGASNKVQKALWNDLFPSGDSRTLAAAGIIIDCVFNKLLNKKNKTL